MSEHEKNAICVLHGGPVPVIGMQQTCGGGDRDSRDDSCGGEHPGDQRCPGDRGCREDKNKTISVRIVDSSNPALPGREAKKVRGIYITGPVAGNEEVLNGVLDGALTAGINAVVIDFKEDQGRITCPVDAATVNEIGASIPYVRDMKSLIESLKKKDLYVIARVAAFRDSYLAEKKPEWSLKLPDGSLYQDRQGMYWVDPYRQEVWDYLLEVGTEAKDLGFDEVQLDYLRFPNEASAGQVVYDEAVIRGRSKTDTILECTNYLYENLASQGLFVSAGCVRHDHRKRRGFHCRRTELYGDGEDSRLYLPDDLPVPLQLWKLRAGTPGYGTV